VGAELQLPVEAARVCPTTALPVIAGSAVFAGGVAAGAGATTEVAFDVAADDPTLFDAVTVTRSLEPTSPATGAYEAFTAPARDEQLLPALSQRSHWYAYELTPPLQLPVLALSVWPTTALPLIVGGAVGVGAFCPLPFPAPPTLGNRNTASSANRMKPALGLDTEVWKRVVTSGPPIWRAASPSVSESSSGVVLFSRHP
jgi:hypothetical protein